MKEISVEGYKVIIEATEGAFTVSVPDLPGCTIQVDKEAEARTSIRRMIGLYLQELASKKPKDKKKNPSTPGRKKLMIF